MGTYAITGSASGMGYETAHRLRGEGHTVIGVDIKEADVTADLSTPHGRQEAAEAVLAVSAGRLDGAGNAPRATMVVGVVDCRVMLARSASVPVLTDHRSTPQLPVDARGLWTIASCSSASGCPLRIAALTPVAMPPMARTAVTMMPMRRSRR